MGWYYFVRAERLSWVHKRGENLHAISAKCCNSDQDQISITHFTSLLALTFHRRGERIVDSERHLDQKGDSQGYQTGGLTRVTERPEYE